MIVIAIVRIRHFLSVQRSLHLILEQLFSIPRCSRLHCIVPALVTKILFSYAATLANTLTASLPSTPLVPAANLDTRGLRRFNGCTTSREPVFGNFASLDLLKYLLGYPVVLSTIG